MNLSEPNRLILPGISDIDLGFRPWKMIASFSEISGMNGTIDSGDCSGNCVNPDNKTLVLCDIDDTLLHHPVLNSNWMNVIQTYFFNNTAFSKYIDELLTTRPMQHTDREGFERLRESSKKLAFVTARFPHTKDFTYQNLKSAGVNPEDHEVHFCGNMRKGKYIANNFDLEEYDRVIFIDDQQRNLESVYAFVDHPGLELYKYDYVREDPATYYPFPRKFPSWVRFNGEDLVNSEPRMGMNFL